METGDGPASVQVEAPPGHLVATVGPQPTGRRKVGRGAGPSAGPAGLGEELQLFGRDRVFERLSPGGRPGAGVTGRELDQVVGGPDELAEAAARAAVADLEAAVEARHGHLVLAGGGTRRPPTGGWPPTTCAPGSSGTGSGWPWATSAACR